MVSKKNLVICLIIGIVPMIYTLLIYGNAPETLPTHFDANGIANEFGSKGMLFLMPGITLGTAILSIFFPYLMKINKSNRYEIKLFEKINCLMLIFLTALSIFINYSMLKYENGNKINLSILYYMVFIFIAIMGIFLDKLKTNAYVGIKIPFTLMDKENWNRTHKFASKLWVVGGILGVVLVFITGDNKWTVIGVMGVLFIVPIIYSTILHYRR